MNKLIDQEPGLPLTLSFVPNWREAPVHLVLEAVGPVPY